MLVYYRFFFGEFILTVLKALPTTEIIVSDHDYKSHLYLEDFNGTLIELLNLYFNSRYWEDVDWCLEQFYKFKISSHVINRCKLYFWQKYSQENPYFVIQSYNQIAVAFSYICNLNHGLYKQRLELRFITKYDTNSDGPAYTRFQVIDFAEPKEKWQGVYIDGLFAFAIYYKGKYQGVISLNFDEEANPIVVQIQTSKKCRLNYKFDVLDFLLEIVIDAFSALSSVLYVQSAANNIYRSPDLSSNRHIVSEDKLLRAYDQVALKHGFHKSGDQNYILTTSK
jgi:hypothetical protein